jgi:hypothetical protein
LLKPLTDNTREIRKRKIRDHNLTAESTII